MIEIVIDLTQILTPLRIGTMTSMSRAIEEKVGSRS